jgi:hypothetical protein
MFDENWSIPSDTENDFPEEVALEFDANADTEAIWEWNGNSWVAVGA